jgi:hypothetical protein
LAGEDVFGVLAEGSADASAGFDAGFGVHIDAADVLVVGEGEAAIGAEELGLVEAIKDVLKEREGLGVGQGFVAQVVGECVLGGGWVGLELESGKAGRAADGAQAGVVCGGVLKGRNTGLLKVAGAVRFEQAGHAHEAAGGLDSTLGDGALGPAACVWTDGFDLTLPVAQGALYRACLIQPTHSAHTAVASGFHAGVTGDLLHAGVEDPHLPAVVTHPDAAADKLRRGLVVSLGYLHITIAPDPAPGLGEGSKELLWQRLEGGLLHGGEVLADLPAGGAMDACISHGLLPLAKVSVELAEGGKLASGQRIVTHMLLAALHLALVLRAVRAAGHGDDVIMAAEGGELGREFWVKPVGAFDRRLEVVEVEHRGHAAKSA